MKHPVIVLTTLLLAILCRPLLAADAPAGSPNFIHSYNDALAEAKKTGKPALLIFSASWCPPCQAMKRDVYPSAAVKPFHDKFVWAYLDADAKENEKPMTEFRISGIPFIKFLSADGKSLGSQTGGSTPEAFAVMLQSMLTRAASTVPGGSGPKVGGSATKP